ncbi:hypothetical protein KGF57_003254 [Candida theae]|uniref:Uncharacterized protein n=1 Tax=Candida theae TaxID=1198502 RepID=A0AAD5BEA0_9ASCO|nr:uncharacterized protein KGF57_003254 [Candida theae]KAI5957560.1 hypothetical protein KGF57_003254 [Candida theae]
MGRRENATPDKPAPLRNNALATDIGEMYSLVSGGLNKSGTQSESSSTLKLLSQLQQEPKQEEGEKFHHVYKSEYMSYGDFEPRSPYLKHDQSSTYREYDRYPIHSDPMPNEQKEECENSMQALDSSAGSSSNSETVRAQLGNVQQFEKVATRNLLALEDSKQQMPSLLQPPKPLSTSKNFAGHSGSEDPVSRVNIAQNIKDILANISNLGAINNDGVPNAATTIDSTGNNSGDGDGDVSMATLNDDRSDHRTTNLLENKSIDGKLPTHDQHPLKEPEAMSRDQGTRAPPLMPAESTQKLSEGNGSIDTVSHALSAGPVHPDNDHFSLETSQKTTKSAHHPNSNERHTEVPAEQKSPHGSYATKSNHTSRDNSSGKAFSFVVPNRGEGLVRFNSAKLKEHLTDSYQPISPFEPNSTIKHNHNLTSSNASAKIKSSKEQLQKYSRFGKQDLSKGESWISQTDAGKYTKTDSQPERHSQRPSRPRSSSVKDSSKGVNTYGSNSWVREGYEPPTKKHKVEPGITQHDSCRPSTYSKFKHIASQLKPSKSNKQFIRDPVNTFKVFGKPNFQMVPYTSDQVEKLLSESLSHPELKVAYFVQKSQDLVHKAHESKVVDKSMQSVFNYQKFIKGAIKCLMLVVKNYTRDLNPQQLVSIYYKIAKLYLNETESLDLAEAYAIKASNVCRDHSFTEFQFFCDLLMIEIYEKFDITTVVGFAQRRVGFYEESGFHALATCLQLARIKYLLVSDVSLALVNMQRLLKDPKLHPSIKQITVVYLAGLHNYRGDHAAVVELLRGFDMKVTQPFAAYVLMTKLLANVCLNNTPESKFLLKELMHILQEGEKFNWGEWSINGDIKFHIKGELDVEFDFVVSWLPVVDFKIMLYFLSGIAYLHSVGDKSKVCFEKAYSLIVNTQSDLKSNRNLATYFTANDSRQRELRLRYIGYLVQFYQQWQFFVNDDAKIVFLNDFMNANNKSFTREEYAMFKPMYPYINYMFALYYHGRGDIQAAKFYYLKVKNMTSTLLENDPSTSLQQMNSRLGGDTVCPKGYFNELHVYSTFHLIILLDYEVNEIMSKKETDESQLAVGKFTAIRNTLFDEFSTGIKQPPKHADSFQYNFVIHNKLLRTTLEITITFLQDISPHLTIKDLRSMLVKLGDKTTFYFVSFIVTYFLIKTSGTSEKTRLIESCFTVLPKSRTETVETSSGNKDQVSISESADSCRVLLLRELIEVHQSTGLHNQVNMEKAQLERLYKLLAHRYTTLEKNVICDPTFKILSQVKSENEDAEMKDA